MSDTAAPASPPEPVFMDDRLAHWARAIPDGEALTYGGRTFTWAEWDDRVRRNAGALRALGIGRGDVVASLDKNHPACVETSMAAGSLGAAHAIVNWRSAPDEVEYALHDCGARVVLVGSELAPPSRRSATGCRRWSGSSRSPPTASAASTRRGWPPPSRRTGPTTWNRPTPAC